MKKLIFFPVSGWLLLMMAGTGSAASASTDAKSQCRQEALDYEISTELIDDYIDGCLASRGELLDHGTTDLDYLSPDMQDNLPDPETGDPDYEQ